MPVGLIIPLLTALAGAAGVVGASEASSKAKDEREAKQKALAKEAEVYANMAAKGQIHPDQSMEWGGRLSEQGAISPEEFGALHETNRGMHQTRTAAHEAMSGFLQHLSGKGQQPTAPTPMDAPIGQPDPRKQQAAYNQGYQGTSGEPAPVGAAETAYPLTKTPRTPQQPATPSLPYKTTVHMTKDGELTASFEERQASVEDENTAKYLQAAHAAGQPALGGLAAATADGVPVKHETFVKQADLEFGEHFVAATREASAANGGMLDPTTERQAILQAADRSGGYIPEKYAQKLFTNPTEAKTYKTGKIAQTMNGELARIAQNGGSAALTPDYFPRILDTLDKEIVGSTPLSPDERGAVLKNIGAGLFTALQSDLMKSGQFTADQANYLAAFGASSRSGGYLPTEIATFMNKDAPYSDDVKKIANAQGIDLRSLTLGKTKELQQQANSRKYFDDIMGRVDPIVAAKNLQEGKTPDQVTPPQSAAALIEGEQARSGELQNRELAQQRRTGLQESELKAIPTPKEFTDSGNFMNALKDVVGWVNHFQAKGEELPSGYITSIWQAVKEQAPLPGMFAADPAAVKLYASLQVMRDIRARAMAGLSQTNTEVDNLEKELATGKLQPEALMARLGAIRNTSMRELKNMVSTADERGANKSVPGWVRETLKNESEFKFLHEHRKKKAK